MSDKKERFNIGDIVVNLENITLWDNVYHFEQFIRTFKNKEVVTQLFNGRFATLDSFDITKYEDRENFKNQYHIYHQNGGASVSGFKQMYNWTTNEKNIRAHFNKLFAEAIKKCDEEDEKEIAKLEEQIRHAQEKIAAIKAGKRTVSFNSKINEREFVNSRMEEINAALDSFNN